MRNSDGFKWKIWLNGEMICQTRRVGHLRGAETNFIDLDID